MFCLDIMISAQKSIVTISIVLTNSNPIGTYDLLESKMKPQYLSSNDINQRQKTTI